MPRINFTWLCYIIIFICNWILFANVLLRIQVDLLEVHPGRNQKPLALRCNQLKSKHLCHSKPYISWPKFFFYTSLPLLSVKYHYFHKLFLYFLTILYLNTLFPSFVTRHNTQLFSPPFSEILFLIWSSNTNPSSTSVFVSFFHLCIS
jgi:hypothetical protein